VNVYRSRLANVCAHLNEHHVRYVLFGAMAMQLWGTTRATRDVDILIDPTMDNADRVIAALSEIGFGFARELTAAELLASHVTMIGDIPKVDVFTLVWSIRYPEASAAVTVFEVEGVPIPTASIDHLIASKRTNRLQDLADIEVLEAIKVVRAQQAPPGTARPLIDEERDETDRG